MKTNPKWKIFYLAHYRDDGGLRKKNACEYIYAANEGDACSILSKHHAPDVTIPYEGGLYTRTFSVENIEILHVVKA